MPDGTRTTAEQQRQLTNLWTVAEQLGTIPNELADLYGIARGTQTQSAKQLAAQITNDVRGLDISQQNADTSRYSAENNVAISGDDNARAWLTYGDKQAESGASKYNGMSSNQIYDVVSKEFQKPVLDEKGRETEKTEIPKDSASKEQMYQRVMGSGLPDGQDTQVLSLLGLSKSEVDALDKKYGVSSGN